PTSNPEFIIGHYADNHFLLIHKGWSQEVVRTITLNAIVLSQMFHLFNSRNIQNFALNKDFFSNKVAFLVSGILILLQLAITYLPFMNKLFGTTPLELQAWLYPFLLGFIVFWLVEMEKWIVRMVRKKEVIS
ncbi:MAG: cation transporting ATPase C-terminal domain-containing protein, partial [Tannerellaceae bacterium]|nr:cation transporting ATPase C-terminal domain-containing protein [Tannerellaceae bacterium]MCD8263847.1 cation transporting ATPase C-terminal domain-containing protein [Tannerellaceae bacterium]